MKQILFLRINWFGTLTLWVFPTLVHAFVPKTGSVESQFVAGTSAIGFSLGAAGQPNASVYENENYFVRKQKLQELERGELKPQREKLPFIWDLGYAYRYLRTLDTTKTISLADQAHFYTGALQWVKEPGFQMRVRVTVNQLPEENLGQGGLFFTPGFAFTKQHLKLFYEWGFLKSVKSPVDSPRTSGSASVQSPTDFYSYSQGPELEWTPEPGIKLNLLARFHRYGFSRGELLRVMDEPFSVHDVGYASDSYFGLAERLLTYPSVNFEASLAWSATPLWNLFFQLSWASFVNGGEERGLFIGGSVRAMRLIAPKWFLGMTFGAGGGSGDSKVLGSVNGAFLF